MRRSTPALAALALTLPLGAATAGQADPAYTVQTLHFKVPIGLNSLGDPGTCDVVGDLYTPAGASAAAPVPAILTTNGFGGSKADQAGLGAYFAGRGYEVLSYSGLGFGGSGCKITLDDPSTDGRAASALVSYLGGAPGIAFTDAKHTAPAPTLDVVERDPLDHDGRAQAHDPRVGMIGGSYGGEIQFAAAADDPRIDTIVPLITWNDLSYSLGPNNTAITSGVTSSVPGSVKLVWGLGFSAEGVADGVQMAQTDPKRIAGCPNFATFVCGALAAGGSLGYFRASDIDRLRHASVSTYMRRITVPTLLMQGENDTLFNLNEAVATYRALKAQGTPVQMIWQRWGHSDSTPAPGEFNQSAPDPATQYETMRVTAWFDHYLRDQSTDLGPDFAYFRPWIGYTGIATPAYAAASSYPVGTERTWSLSGTNGLTEDPASVQSGFQTFRATVAGTPTSLSSPDAVASMFSGANALFGRSLAGTTASWSSPALTAPVDVVGTPTATLKVNAVVTNATQRPADAGRLVLMLRVEDVAPDGTLSPIAGEIAPVRIPDARKPFAVTLPAIVHRFDTGHRIALVIEGGDTNYRGNLVASTVTVAAGAGQTLSLPVTD